MDRLINIGAEPVSFIMVARGIKSIERCIMYTRLHADENGIIGKGVKFERIRRVTGYLVGTLDRFNNAKRAEVRDRVKHMHA